MATAQELLRRHQIDYVETRKGKYTTSCPNCSGGYLNVEIKNDGVVWYCQNCKEGSGERFDQTEGHVSNDDLGPIKATYDYVDELGKRLFQVLRFEPVNAAKQFRQRVGPEQEKWSIKGVRIVPFHLPELIEAIAEDHPVFICEGEKDVLTLARHGIPATCNPMGAGKWWPEFNPIFRDANVVICVDNDEPGRNHGNLVARNLLPIAACVRLLDLADHCSMQPSEDITDWFIRRDGSAAQLWEIVEHLPQIRTPATNGKGNGAAVPAPVLPVIYPFPIDEPTLPVRNWAVPGLLMRCQVSVLVAPSGSGKSLLTLQLGIACAQGKAWAGWIPRQKFRVMVINSEDDVDEMRRRLAAAARVMNVDQDAIRNSIALVDNSANGGAVVAKFDAKTKTLVRTPLLEQLVKIILDNQIDIIFVDPFAETFEGDENSNSELKWAGIIWREVARCTRVAVCLVHHTKKYATGMAGDVDAARGAGALIGIARIVSTLFPMTTREAETMLKPADQDKRGLYLRYDDAKANLNIISPFARWFFKQTITLDNKTPELPGDDVGVLIPWKPEGPSVLEAQIVAFFKRVDQGIVDQDGQPTGEFYAFDSRGRKTGRSIVDFAQEFFEIETRTAAEKLVDDLKRNKRLEQIQYRSPRQRRASPRVVSELDPAAPKHRKAAGNGHDDMQPEQQAFNYGWPGNRDGN